MARKSILTTLAVLAALALAGCGSSSKAPTAIDTAPPQAPTGLVVWSAGSSVVITWAPNTTDADFAGFVVRRIARGTNVMLVEAPADVTEYADAAPLRGTVNTYSVSAVDDAGNWSAYATISVDLSAPSPAPIPLDPTFGDTWLSTGGDGPSGRSGSDRHQH